MFERTLDSINDIAADAELNEDIELVMSNITMDYNKAQAYCFLEDLSLVNHESDVELEIVRFLYLEIFQSIFLDNGNS